MQIFLMLSLLLAQPQAASAKEINDIAELGSHQQIFVLEKNQSRENIAIIYTKVDEKCRFITDPANRDEPVFDFYWRMNGTSYKPMASFFKNTFRARVQFQRGNGDSAKSFVFLITDLKEVKHDLVDPKLEVVSKVDGKSCNVEAYTTLGPSDGNARIRLDSIYGEGSMFGAIYSVTLSGEVVDRNGKPTGKKISHKYLGK